MIQRSVVASGDFIGRDQIIHNWQIQAVPSASEEQSVRVILSACYRRAIFTEMHAQLSTEAMLGSIAEAIRLIQPQIPKLASPHLQEMAGNLLIALDNIMRIGAKDFDEQSFEQINHAKLQALHWLARLARETDSPYVIPQGRLVEGTFFTKAEADVAPEEN